MPFLIVVKISLSQLRSRSRLTCRLSISARRLAGLGDFLAALVVQQLCPTGFRLALCRVLSSQPWIAVVLDRALAADRLSARLRHGARAAALAAGAVHAGRAAVLDLIPDPRLCLDDHPPARRTCSTRCLLGFGIVQVQPVWLRPTRPSIIGIVYTYLPFMVLPIYATLEKMDESLLEAAADLGCPRWKAFWLVTVPLALPGVVAGCAAVLHSDRRRVRRSRICSAVRRR